MTEVLDRLRNAISDRYAIEHELGAGGMATVYLADDVKHDRKVALKVLRPELAAVIGAERFLHEIKVTANLQHPHILPLHDSGDADGFLFYVMPYVEGETLRDKLQREKQLGIDEAVEITKAVAAALDYAHRNDVIHRDIKPENILIHDGQALVADFGIALAVSQAGGTRLTETGLSVGTPHYMSPEQAMGDRELDARSDVYSLGAMLYEMLAGDPPYTGSTAQAIVAKVITEKAPPVTTHRDTVPMHVAASISKALSKLPADRFTSAADFAAALTNPAFVLPTTAALHAPADLTAARRAQWARFTWPAVAAVLAVLTLWGWFRPDPPPAVTRYGLALPPDQPLTDVFHPTFAIAPDGSWIVYVGPGDDGGQLWVKARDRYEATPLSGTVGARGPVVSPDGEWIAFVADGQLRKIPAGGGSAITLTDSVQMTLRSATWLDDGSLVFADNGWSLRKVPDVGGAAEVVWTPEQGRFAALPTGLPGSRGVLFTLCDANCRTVTESWVLDLQSGEAHLLNADVVQSWYAATGHLVYVRPDGGVFAVPFDLGALELRGAAVPVLEGVKVDQLLVPDFALSPGGMLMMIAGATGTARTATRAVWVARDGTATAVDPNWSFDPGANVGWVLSPDGRRLAVKILSDAGDDIWIKELDDGPLSRLTFHGEREQRPGWTPDGRSVTFVSDRTGQMDLFVKRADGTGPAELLFDHESPIWESLWSPDGTWLIVRVGGTAEAQRDILGIRPGTDSVPVPLAATGFQETAPTLSPDGRWLAYASDETGRYEVYVRPFPDTEGGKWQVSTDGGRSPLWAHSGRELFYLNGGAEMVAAQVVTTPSFSVGERQVLFPFGEDYANTNLGRPYDVTPDDQRFVMVRFAGSGDEDDPGALIVVENFFEELKEKMGR